MSRLLIVTRSALVPGFHLAGVDAYGADDVDAAQEMIDRWLKAGEAGLLAVDDGLLELMDPSFIKTLEASERLPFLGIPGGGPLGPQVSQRHRITEMIRRAIGFHITFRGQDTEES
jgi:vacuolar-type H+-ATPase subunit F/Vma7